MIDLVLQTPGPSTEPRNPETPKVHFKVRKMPFSTPQRKGPKSQLKCPKTPFLDILIPPNGVFGNFNWLLGPFFWGVENGIFRTLKCTFGVSGFRGSVEGPGVCKPCAVFAGKCKKRCHGWCSAWNVAPAAAQSMALLRSVPQPHHHEVCCQNRNYHRGQIITKKSLQWKCFGAINFVKITKESLYKANSLACFVAKGTRQWQQHYKENLLVELFL